MFFRILQQVAKKCDTGPDIFCGGAAPKQFESFSRVSRVGFLGFFAGGFFLYSDACDSGEFPAEQ